MVAIVIETSTPQASIARVMPDGVVQANGFQSDRNHNAMLFEPLADILAGASVATVEVVVVGSGPGSYSGTRVGIATAQGVAVVAGCEAVAVPSILAVPSALGGQRCVAVGDARRGAYWVATMEGWQVLDGPVVCDAQEFRQHMNLAISQDVPVVAFEDPKRFPVEADQQAKISLEYPTAEGLWTVWKNAPDAAKQAWRNEVAQPVYIKPPHITIGKNPCMVQAPLDLPESPTKSNHA